MPTYEVRLCEGSSPEKWCIFVNGARDSSLGEFDTRADAETKVCQLILRDKVLTLDPFAKFEIPTPSKNPRYSGSVIATVHLSQGSGHGIAQSVGRGVHALHTGEKFATVPPGTKITVNYRGEEIMLEFPMQKERGGNER